MAHREAHTCLPKNSGYGWHDREKNLNQITLSNGKSRWNFCTNRYKTLPICGKCPYEKKNESAIMNLSNVPE